MEPRADRPVSGEELCFLRTLTTSIVSDVASKCGVDLSRDIMTIKNRVASEGYPFLSKTLPNLSKALLQGLEQGVLTSPTSFAKKRKGHVVKALPSFLIGLTQLVFDESSGKLRNEAEPRHVAALRQICEVFYKYEVPSTVEQIYETYDKLIDIDASLANPETYPHWLDSRNTRGLMLRLARNLLLDLFSGFDLLDIIPRNGTGATNNPYVSLQSDKYEFIRDLPEATEVCYPMLDYFSPSAASRRSGGAFGKYLPPAQLDTRANNIDRYRTCDGRTIVLDVPKDSRGPRIIGKEPSEMQALQQGQRRAIQRLVEEHPLTRGHVNFSDQSVNAQLALKSSLTREFATLDMKDASDRVSVSLVQAIFPSDIAQCLLATRSDYAEITYPFLGDSPSRRFVFDRGGLRRIIKVKKFALMGSGTCFPVESLVFWSLTVAALEILGLSKDDALAQVYVYGDDTIVPSDYAEGVVKLVSRFGLRYNAAKCFSKGFFRESCGMDAFKGVDVTPLRIKKRVPIELADAAEIVSYVKVANQFANKGYWSTYNVLKERIESIPKLGQLPYGRENSNFLCWYVENPGVDKRWGSEKKPTRMARVFVCENTKTWVGEIDGSHTHPVSRLLIKRLAVSDENRPWYQGQTITAWVYGPEEYLGSDHGLSEGARYFRWVTEHGSDLPDTDAFSKRHTLRLKKRRCIVA